MNYWTRQADDLLIGKFIGSEGLGIYTKAYGTMVLPLRQITSVFTQVMFPALSKIQGDIERVKRIYLKCNRLIAFVTVPMMVGLAVVAEHFVVALYGEHWAAMVPIVQILCLVGIKQPIGSTTGWIFQSQGRTDIMFQWNIVVSSITVVSFIIGIQWGVIGVAWAYAIRSYVVWYHGITIPGQLIDMSFYYFVKNVAGIFIISLLMACTVIGIQFLLPSNWSIVLMLAVEVGIGIISYLAFAIIFRLQAFKEIKNFAYSRILNSTVK